MNSPAPPPLEVVFFHVLATRWALFVRVHYVLLVMYIYTIYILYTYIQIYTVILTPLCCENLSLVLLGNLYLLLPMLILLVHVFEFFKSSILVKYLVKQIGFLKFSILVTHPILDLRHIDSFKSSILNILYIRTPVFDWSNPNLWLIILYTLHAIHILPSLNPMFFLREIQVLASKSHNFSSSFPH